MKGGSGSNLGEAPTLAASGAWDQERLCVLVCHKLVDVSVVRLYNNGVSLESVCK